jgi:hypothetical protein
MAKSVGVFTTALKNHRTAAAMAKNAERIVIALIFFKAQPPTLTGRGKQAKRRFHGPLHGPVSLRSERKGCTWDLVPHMLHDVLLHRHLYCGRGIRDTLEDRRFTQQRSPVRVFARR